MPAPRVTLSAEGGGGAPAWVIDRIAIASVAELGAVLDELATGGRLPGLIDLVAHSSSAAGYLLRVGDDLLDPAIGRVARALGPLRGAAPGTTLRLVGCRTAATTRARRALRGLRELTGIRTLGAIEPISDFHFDAAGVRPAYDNRFVDGEWAPPPWYYGSLRDAA